MVRQHNLILRLIGPLPVNDFRLIDPVFVRVTAAGYLLVLEFILGVSPCYSESGHTIDHIDRNTEPIDFVANR